MSYNIDSIKYASGKLRIKRGIALQFAGKEMPDDNLITDLDLLGCDAEELLVISQPTWSGEWSGHSFDLFKSILAHTVGCATILIVWERGDSTSGLVVENGNVREGKVRYIVE